MDEEKTTTMEDLNPSFDDNLYVSIIQTYLDTESVKETAEKLETSPVKVRKVLITEGLWSSRTSQEIQHYLNLGKTTAEIAVILSTTEKAVQQYLPYTRGLYNSGTPSVAALNSADYRARIKIAQEKTLRQNLALAVENKWYEMYETPGMRYLREAGIGMEPHKRDFYPGTLELPDDTDCSKFYRFDCSPIRLHLELERSDAYNEESLREGTEILKAYGNVQYGDTISRDIIVPGDMPLWALNYAIQRCFGWQNSHLHCFELPEDQYKRITDSSFSNYLYLVGVVFRSPFMDQEEEFWMDDYESGSFKTWIKKKYRGPFNSMCHAEGIWQCRQDIKQMRWRFKYLETEHCFRGDGFEYYHNTRVISEEEYRKRKREGYETVETERFGSKIRMTKEVYPFDELPLDAVGWMFDRPLNQLLERLPVGDVLAGKHKGMDDEVKDGFKAANSYEELMEEDFVWEIEEYEMVDDPNKQPIVNTLCDDLYYKYDFGDGWVVKITASFGAADLVESGRVTQEELENAVTEVRSKFKPVCIAQDGLPVLDDVGGMTGYLDFLQGINGKGEAGGLYEDAKDSLEWAKGLGWSKRKTSNQSLL